ncbi:MAG: ATP-binding protein [Clostridiales Family XIII bacterium]|nr:ATP-binding protein [Clostridiales Family XIII bacterium]
MSMYVEREIGDKLKDYAEQFPVVYLTGPRQSGKSTLLKHSFPGYAHVNLEEKDVREFAQEDPRGFLGELGGNAVIDEAQYAPDLFSYIQPTVDERGEAGQFILSGSQNFLLMRNISQSLAGRVGILSLLPFSLREMESADIGESDADSLMLGGFYPRRVAKSLISGDYYKNYIKTYVERDVRLETGVQDLDRFSSFMHICAQGVGTPLNLSGIGAAVKADSRTVASWLNILEESYIIFRLKPYTRKDVPRYSKTPKLYFYDTGLLCSLLGIGSGGTLSTHRLRGMVFENMVIADYFKSVFNAGGFPQDSVCFWRDGSDRDKEIDMIVEESDRLKLYEIKSSETARGKYADNLGLFEKNSEGVRCEKNVIYNGPNRLTKNGTAYWPFKGWQHIGK